VTNSISDWRESLKDFLAAGGLLGYKQSVLTARFDDYCSSEQLEAELLFLAATDRAQKFVVPKEGRRGGKSYTIWRATNKIHEEDQT
jgi:hypothetical protein